MSLSAYTNFWTKKTSIEGLSFEDKCFDMSKLDYINFLNGTNNQVNHESEDVLKLQKSLSKYHR